MLAWVKRSRARYRLGRSIAVWYHPDYAARRFSERARLAGINPLRGELILGELAAEKLIRAGQAHLPQPATLRALGWFHEPAYLESVTRPETLAPIFGLEAGLIDADDLLQAQRRAVGGTIAAAEAAVSGRLRVAVNLGGGFHHAEPGRGGGFCVYNDIAVAIAMLRRRGFNRPIAIVDLDFHQGNGNLVAFARDPSVLTYSLHGAVWERTEGVANLDVLLGPGTRSRDYLRRLEETLPEALERHAPGLVFYLAGNDVLAGDALGSFELSPVGVLERDRRVLRLVERLGVPAVITLGGGYSPAAWPSTTNLLRWLLTDEARAMRSARPDRELSQLYRRVARTLDPFELQRQEPLEFGITEAELLGDLAGEASAARFLDYYSAQGFEYALERYGLLEALRERGYSDLRVSLDLRDTRNQILRVHGCKEQTPWHYALLVELVGRRLELAAPEGISPSTPLQLLDIEWLLLQDPSASFSSGRPRLPGQANPGLGLGAEMLELLVRVCHRLTLDGLLHRPAHFHNALVGARRFRFLLPEDAGRFEAIRRVLAGRPLPEATSLVDSGSLVRGDGSPVAWEPANFVLPVSGRLEEYLGSKPYQERAGLVARALLEAGLHVGTSPPVPRLLVAEEDPALDAGLR